MGNGWEGMRVVAGSASGAGGWLEGGGDGMRETRAGP